VKMYRSCTENGGSVSAMFPMLLAPIRSLVW
jgi:hypothetical protein